MIREICKDEAFLAQKAEPAVPEDIQIAADLLETLEQLLTSSPLGAVSGLATEEAVHQRFTSLVARGASKDIGSALSLVLGVLSTQTYAQAIWSGKSDSAARKGALLSALLIHWHEPLLLLLGTPGELMVPAREYLVWFTLFLAPLAVFNILMFIVRLDGAPGFAMACNIMAACINIVLDYLFIFVFEWGLAGAAVATGIGYVVGSGVMLWYMFRRSRTLRFVKLKISGKSMRLTVRNLWYMSYIGFPALLSELAISCLMIVGNYTFIHYVGKDGVAAYSIACYIFPIIFMVYNGIIQSAQPIISYNYGAGLMRRGRKALRMALGTAALCGAAAFGFTWLCSPWIVGLFLTPDAPAYAIAVQGLPWFAAGYPFFGINVVTIGYYQSIERGRLATGLTVLRGIVLMTFCFLVMPHMAGVTGIWLAVPVAEALETLLLVYLLRSRRFASA